MSRMEIKSDKVLKNNDFDNYDDDFDRCDGMNTLDMDYVVTDPTGNITVLILSSYSDDSESNIDSVNSDDSESNIDSGNADDSESNIDSGNADDSESNVDSESAGVSDKRSQMIKQAFEMESACEQVGFVEPVSEGHIKLEMMGYEFCGNASLSAASWQAFQDGLEEDEKAVILVDSSGVSETLQVDIRRLEDTRLCDAATLYPHFVGRIMMPVPEVGSFKGHPIVHMDGISHIIVNGSDFTEEDAESKIKEFAEELGVPALGILLCSSDHSESGVLDSTVEIQPLVYVKDSDTLVWEHGCATGSTAIGYYRYYRYMQNHNMECNGECNEGEKAMHTNVDNGTISFVTDVIQPGGLISINIKNGQPELTGHVILKQY